MYQILLKMKTCGVIGYLGISVIDWYISRPLGNGGVMGIYVHIDPGYV